MEFNQLEQEKAIYLEKLEAQQLGINKILKLKNQSNLISADIEKKLRDSLNKIALLQDKLKNNTYEVAIVGLEKAGKSSFANALIESDILPSKDDRCTYTSTSIMYGSEEKAEVSFFSKSEFNHQFQMNLKTMGINNATHYHYDTLSLEAYNKMFEVLEEENPNVALIHAGTHKDIQNIIRNEKSISQYLDRGTLVFADEELKSNDFKGFIEDEARAVAVKEIIIRSNKLSQMQNVKIYDVPGFDSPTQMHEDQTVDKMKQADAIILIANTSKPSFTGPQVKIFSKYTDEDGVSLNDKLFIFGNKSDAPANVDRLRLNVETLEKEIFERYGLLDFKHKDRFIYGSAKAYLQKCNKDIDPGTACADKLKDFGLNDNIEEIRLALERYNKEERFKILKARINKIFEDIKNLFASIREDYSISADYNANEELGIAMKFRRQSAATASYNLKAFNTNIIRQMSDKALTQKLIETIKTCITLEKFQITDAEIDESRTRLISGVTQTEVPDKVDHDLRGQRFKVLYNSFEKNILSLATSESEQIYEEIVDIFMNSLEISTGNIYYDELKVNATNYVEAIKGNINEDGYYLSLIERFARKVFEILIIHPYMSHARLETFENHLSDFYSLTMFYKHRDDELPIGEQPMLGQLLYHDADNDHANVKKIVNEALDLINKVTGISSSQNLVKLLEKIVLNKGNVLEDIKKLLVRLDCPQDNKLNILELMLNREFLKDELSTETPKSNIHDQYLEKMASCRSNSYEWVKDSINQDIQILQDILINAVVPAIGIEVPFISRITKVFEDLEASFETDIFDDFIQSNIKKIKSECFNKLQKEAADRMIKAEIVNEINQILLEMNR